jgi:hypothetical protein
MYKKATNKSEVSLIKTIIVICGYVAFPALGLAWLSQHITEPFNSIIIVIGLSVVFSVIRKSNLKHNIFYLGISYAVSHILYLVSTFISTVALVILFDIKSENIWLLFIVFVLNAVFTLIIYKMKFKIAINYNNNIASAGTAIAGIALIIYSVFRVEGRLQNEHLALLFAGIILCGLGLLQSAILLKCSR